MAEEAVRTLSQGRVYQPEALPVPAIPTREKRRGHG
jgi:hypothetical protein